MNIHKHDEVLRERLARRISAFERREIPREGRRAAAVALCVARDGRQPVIVVTRRSASLRAHSRQWALPGGRRDPGETAIQGALRELQEEVGLRLDAADVLGTLDDYATRSGYVITPVVAWAEADWRELTANPAEVDLVRPFPFHELARRDSPILQNIAESDAKVLSMHFQGDAIYAPTGAMLYQFREVALCSRPTRVAHFEQPVFAWR